MNKYKPILFSTPMVQAILDGRKTMTRRIVKSKHESGLFRVCKTKDGKITEITSLDWDERPKNDCTNDIQPKYKFGDILWVRETWNKWQVKDRPFVYRATDLKSCGHTWKPSIYMPKEAARVFLQITGIRVECLQDITEEDAIAEGCGLNTFGGYNARFNFENLWNQINGKDSWNQNPYVWVYSFNHIGKPKDFLK
jgi:hypothetical protein